STAALNEAAKRVRGRNGSGALNRLLDFASPRAGSPGESLARVVFAEHGLPAPLLGEPIVVDGELLGVVDFLWPSHATVAELDGRAKYRPTNDRGEDVLWQEKLREERLREAGFEVV